MNRLRLLSAAVVAASVMSTASVAAAASSGAHAAAKPPAAPSALRAYETSHGVQIAWTDPHSKYDHLVVRYRRSVHAPTRTQGRAVTVTRKTTHVTLHHLVPGAAYSVSVWTRNGTSRYSSRATLGFRAPRKAGPVAPGTVRGVVKDDAGHPLRNVLVEAVSLSGGTDRETLTDAAGAYAVKLAPGDAYVDVNPIQASGGDSDATGYHPDSNDVTVVSKATRTVNFALQPGGAITGRVVDTKGQPRRNVYVFEQAASPVAPYSQGFVSFGSLGAGPVLTKADGTYTLKGALDYAATLCTSAPGPSGNADGQYCGRRTLAVAPRATRHVDDITVAPAATAAAGGAINLTVSAGGRRVDNALVLVEGIDNQTNDVGEIGEANENGAVYASGLPAGAYAVCAAVSEDTRRVQAASGYQSLCKQVRVAVKKTTSVTLVLPLGAAVSGTVVGPNGRPVPNASVDIEQFTDDGGSDGGALTDSVGRFKATGLPPGSYHICAEPTDVSRSLPHGTRAACAGARTSTLTAGTTRILDVTVHSGAAVKGVVRTANHAVLKDFADIEAMSRSDGSEFETSTQNGHYLLGGLSALKYDVCAGVFHFSGAISQACGTVATKLLRTATLDLTLPQEGTVQAKATDGAGNPLSGVDAVLLKHCTRQDVVDAVYGGCGPVDAYSDTKKMTVVASANTFADGTVPLDGVAPTSPGEGYVLCLLGSQAASTAVDLPDAGLHDACTADDVQVTDGATTDRTVVLDEGASVAGRVLDKLGKPIKGVKVFVSHSAVVAQAEDDDDWGADPADAVTAADGTYTVYSVTPGNQTICFDASTAGTTKSGYLDQCIGGTPGNTDDGVAQPLAVGANTVPDQALQPGPSRLGQLRPAARKPSGVKRFASIDARGRVAAVTHPADLLLAKLHATPHTAGSISRWWQGNSTRLAAVPRAAVSGSQLRRLPVRVAR